MSVDRGQTHSRMGLRASRSRSAQAGISLIELLIAIVVISISLAGFLRTVGQTTGSSSDPARRYQALMIARSYMDEILAAPYLTPASPACVLGAAGPRSLYDDVCDYHGLREAPRDRLGDQIGGLEDFTVEVGIDNVAAMLGALVSPDVVRVDIEVVYNGSIREQVNLSGYKTACPSC